MPRSLLSHPALALVLPPLQGHMLSRGLLRSAGTGCDLWREPPTQAPHCFEPEPGSFRLLSSSKICTQIASCVPPSAPTDCHSPSTKGEMPGSRAGVGGLPESPGRWGGREGGAPETLPLGPAPLGSRSGVHGPPPCPRPGCLRIATPSELGSGHPCASNSPKGPRSREVCSRKGMLVSHSSP